MIIACDCDWTSAELDAISDCKIDALLFDFEVDATSLELNEMEGGTDGAHNTVSYRVGSAFPPLVRYLRPARKLQVA